MEKTDMSTALAIFLVATAVVMSGALAIIPTTMQTASANHGVAHGEGGGCGTGGCGGDQAVLEDSGRTGGFGGGGGRGEGGLGSGVGNGFGDLHCGGGSGSGVGEGGGSGGHVGGGSC